MNPPPINALIAAFGAHNWLALVLAAAVYLRFLFSDESKFPATWNPELRPLFSGIAGAIVVSVTARDNGAAWGVAVMAGVGGLVAGGFVDGMACAIWGTTAKAPAWARWLVMAIDGIFGGPGSKHVEVVQQTKTTVDVVTAEANKMVQKNGRMVAGLACMFVVLSTQVIAVETGCTNGQINPQTQAEIVAAEELGACVESTFAADSQKSPPPTAEQIAIDEGVACGADLADLVALFGSSQIAARSAVAKAAQANPAAIHAAAASRSARH
jgi:hypothetical protein